MSDELNALLQGEEILGELSKHCPDMVLPTGYVFQRTAAAIVQSKDSSKMTATFAIVTRNSQPNRYGNQLQLLPNANGAGPVTQYYAANPVVLYDHGMSGLTLPIGLSAEPGGPLSLSFSADKGIATCYFSDRPWAEPIFAAVDDGLLKMASIGFDPILAQRIRPAGPQQAAAPDGVQDLTWLGVDFVQWEMLEWSVVPIGADRGALRQCLDRGKIAGIKLPQFLKQSFAQHAAEVKKLGIGAEFKPDTVQAKKDPTCEKCGKQLQCVNCVKQSEAEPDPDIAPGIDMSYPSPTEVAQACVAHVHQSQVKAVQETVLKGVRQSIKTAVAPIATSIQNSSAEFQRMTGRIND